MVASLSHHRRLNPNMRVTERTYCVCYPLNLKLGLEHITGISSPTELFRENVDRTCYKVTIWRQYSSKLIQKSRKIFYPLTHIKGKETKLYLNRTCSSLGSHQTSHQISYFPKPKLSRKWKRILFSSNHRSLVCFSYTVF